MRFRGKRSRQIIVEALNTIEALAFAALDAEPDEIEELTEDIESNVCIINDQLIDDEKE